jgi:putative ubiquitin-RnfH superfamily antitoxin RatB of RatAB toxin-antitoxin module
MAKTLNVSLIYIDEQQHRFEKKMILPASSVVRDAVAASGILGHYPDWQIDELSLGIYSQRATLDDELHEADRIEIYRPLLIDPKDRRRKIVNQQRDPKKWRRVRA